MTNITEIYKLLNYNVIPSHFLIDCLKNRKVRSNGELRKFLENQLNPISDFSSNFFIFNS